MRRSKVSSRSTDPIFVELDGLSELGRLACALERAPTPIFSINHGNDFIMATQSDIHLRRPIFYFSRTAESGALLGYRNSVGTEETLMTDSDNSPLFTYAPVIGVRGLPELFQRGLKNTRVKGRKCSSIEVRDLASLAKISSYRTLFEEPPAPIFLFIFREKWFLAVFGRMEEFDEPALCFYLRLDGEARERFVKYSTHKAGDAGFTNRTEDHGYVYMKIVKLASDHPLVAPEA